MFEKYEKFWVLVIIAIVIYYFYKKGSMKTSPDSLCGASAAGSSPAGSSSNLASSLHEMVVDNFGSLVNPTLEPKTVQPAQSTRPVLYTPAQPSTVQTPQRVSAGSYSWRPQPVSPLRLVRA